MISHTDCKHIEYYSNLTQQCKSFNNIPSNAFCDDLDVQRNFLRPVESKYRHGCPPQGLDKSRLYGVNSTVHNNYPTSTTRPKF